MFRIISDDIIMTGFFHKAFQTRNKKKQNKAKTKNKQVRTCLEVTDSMET